MGGAEQARAEGYLQGRVPLQTLRADIDYGTARANTQYGVVGVKVWVLKAKLLAKNSAVLQLCQKPKMKIRKNVVDQNLVLAGVVLTSKVGAGVLVLVVLVLVLALVLVLTEVEVSRKESKDASA